MKRVEEVLKKKPRRWNRAGFWYSTDGIEESERGWPDQERACGWRAGVWLESGVEGGAVGVGVGEDGAVVGADVAADGAVGAAVVGGDGDGHHHSYQPSASSGFVSVNK